MMASCYKTEPLSEFESEKVAKMRENGTTLQGAQKTRWALRRKRKMMVIERPKKDSDE